MKATKLAIPFLAILSSADASAGAGASYAYGYCAEQGGAITVYDGPIVMLPDKSCTQTHRIVCVNGDGYTFTERMNPAACVLAQAYGYPRFHYFNKPVF